MRCAGFPSLAFAFALGAVPTLGLPAEPAALPPPAYAAEHLAEGVHLLRPSKPDPWRNNSLVIEGPNGLVVVDAQPSPSSARDLLGAIRELSAKPIRYLVLTHPHAAAIGGADAFPPETVRVMSRMAYELLTSPDFDPGAEMAARDPEGWKAAAATPPRVDVLLGGRIEILEGSHIELWPLPPAHTSGDLVVFLSEAKIAAVGHLLFPDRNPYGRDANLGGWVATLNRILEQQPSTFVPLEGKALDPIAVRRLRDGFAWIRGEISIAFRELVPRAELVNWLRAREHFPTHFDPDAEPFFLPQLVERGIAEEIVARRKRGLPIPD